MTGISPTYSDDENVLSAVAMRITIDVTRATSRAYRARAASSLWSLPSAPSALAHLTVVLADDRMHKITICMHKQQCLHHHDHPETCIPILVFLFHARLNNTAFVDPTPNSCTYSSRCAECLHICLHQCNQHLRYHHSHCHLSRYRCRIHHTHRHC